MRVEARETLLKVWGPRGCKSCLDKGISTSAEISIVHLGKVKLVAGKKSCFMPNALSPYLV